MVYKSVVGTHYNHCSGPIYFIAMDLFTGFNNFELSTFKYSLYIENLFVITLPNKISLCNFLPQVSFKMAELRSMCMALVYLSRLSTSYAQQVIVLFLFSWLSNQIYNVSTIIKRSGASNIIQSEAIKVLQFFNK